MTQKIHLMTTSALRDEVLSHSDALLWGELQKRELAGLCFNPNEVNIECRSNQHFMYVKDQVLTESGVLLVRLMRHASERAYGVARMYESLGGYVSDPVSTLSYAGSKLLPFISRRAHIPQVPTYFFHRGMATIAQIEAVVSFPFIIKPHYGSRGVGVELISNEEEYKNYLERSEEVEVIAQQFLQNIDAEYRVIVVGGEVIGMVRKNRPKDEQSFLGETDRDEVVEDSAVGELAKRAAATSGGDVYGADIVRLRTGDLYLIENNRCPDFITFREATGIPVESVIVDFLIQKYLQ